MCVNVYVHLLILCDQHSCPILKEFAAIPINYLRMLLLFSFYLTGGKLITPERTGFQNIKTSNFSQVMGNNSKNGNKYNKWHVSKGIYKNYHL